MAIGPASTFTIGSTTVELVSCSGPNVTVPDIGSIHTGSEFKGYRPGIKDLGEFSFKFLYHSEDADALMDLLGVGEQECTINIEDGSSCSFEGYLKELNLGEIAAEPYCYSTGFLDSRKG